MREKKEERYKRGKKTGKKVRLFCPIDSKKYEKKRERKNEMGEEKNWERQLGFVLLALRNCANANSNRFVTVDTKPVLNRC